MEVENDYITRAAFVCRKMSQTVEISETRSTCSINLHVRESLSLKDRCPVVGRLECASHRQLLVRLQLVLGRLSAHPIFLSVQAILLCNRMI